MCVPDSGTPGKPWASLLASIDRLLRPVLRASGLFGDACESEVRVEAMGVVISLDGAPRQQWHPDSQFQDGLLNVFIPLVDLSPRNGPTELALGTHRVPKPCCPTAVAPLLEKGSVLIFDWRVWHRGLGNTSGAERPVAYVTYARAGVEAASYKAGLPSLGAWEAVWCNPSVDAESGRHAHESEEEGGERHEVDDDG